MQQFRAKKFTSNCRFDLVRDNMGQIVIAAMFPSITLLPQVINRGSKEESQDIVFQTARGRTQQSNQTSIIKRGERSIPQDLTRERAIKEQMFVAFIPALQS